MAEAKANLKRSFDAAGFSLYGDDVASSSSLSGSETKRPNICGNNNVSGEVDERRNQSASGSAAHNTDESGGVFKAKYLLTACGWRKGEREEMQDRHVVMEGFSIEASGIERSSFFALFDGHAGKAAAEYCAANFAKRLGDNCAKYSLPAKDLVSVEKSMKKIFTDTYKAVDDEFLKEAKKSRPTLKDGTTATTLLLLNDVLYCANIGDSKAVVCRQKSGTDEKNLAMQITVDHSPLAFNERMRIQKAGGTVKDGRVLGILEVSRSIGDGQFKAHGVTCIPDIKKLTLTDDDLFIVLACDGLWKCFSSEEAINFVVDKYRAAKADPEFDGDLNAVWLKIADELSASAVQRGCGDNVSVILVVFAERLLNRIG